MKFREEKMSNEGQGKWTVTIDGEEYTKILTKAQNRVKNKIEVPGFRKGKAPAKEIEKFLTPSRIYKEAFNLGIDPAFQFALATEHKIKPMNSPMPNLKKVSDKVMEIEFLFDLSPEIKLGKYTGITTIKKQVAKVSDEEITAEIKKYQERFLMEKTRDKKEKIHQGDKVTFDFQGFIGGEPFKGGEAKDHQLVIGSHQFIPGFEEAMVGLGLGEKSIKVTFPEDYGQSLGGKEATFKLKISEIKERIYPEVDEELVKDLNLKGVKTITDLKTKVKKDLKAQKTRAAKIQFVNEVMNEIIKTSEIEIPKSAVEHQIKELKKEFEQQVIRQGLTLKDYKKITKMTDEDIEREITGDAKLRLQSFLVTNEIKAQEKFEIEEAKLETKYQELADQFGLEVAHLKTMLTPDQLSEELLSETINDFLFENNG